MFLNPWWWPGTEQPPCHLLLAGCKSWKGSKWAQNLNIHYFLSQYRHLPSHVRAPASIWDKKPRARQAPSFIFLVTSEMPPSPHYLKTDFCPCLPSPAKHFPVCLWRQDVADVQRFGRQKTFCCKDGCFILPSVIYFCDPGQEQSLWSEGNQWPLQSCFHHAGRFHLQLH